MVEYFVWLLAVSLILALIFKVFKRRIPLSARVLYGSVGISFTLGMIFPIAVANLTPGKVVAVFLGLIVFSAAVLSYKDSKNFPESAPASRQPEAPDKETLDTGPLESPPPVSIETPSPILTESPVDPEPCPGSDGAKPSRSGVENGVGAETQTQATANPVHEVEEKEELVKELPEETPAAGNRKNKAETAPAGTELRAVAPEPPPGQSEGEGENKEEDRPTGEETAAGLDLTASEAGPEPVTAGDYVTAGFKAKSAGDLTGAVKYFLKALGLCREPQVYAALALEISAVYQETGQYFQAGMFLRSVAGQGSAGFSGYPGRTAKACRNARRALLKNTRFGFNKSQP